tara:strand:- start:183 stop:392 length:210 start_codon:yes stop_codon:yes gene_type:complete
MNNARKAQISPVRIDKLRVLREFSKNFSLKKAKFTSNAHKLSSIIGKRKPIKIGVKQIKKARKDFVPFN